MKDYKKYCFEVYYQRSAGPLFNAKTLFAYDYLDAVDLMYTLVPDAIINDVHPIGKSAEILGYDPAFTSFR